MAKFKAERFANLSIPFNLGTIKVDAKGIFEVVDSEFIKFLETSTNFERLDAPKVEKKNPALQTVKVDDKPESKE